MKVFAYDKAKQQRVFAGTAQGGVFRRRVRPEHRLREFDCYAIQEPVFRQLVELGVTIIWLEEDNRILESKLKDWLGPDIRVIDLGHGRQRLFSIDKMEVREK